MQYYYSSKRPDSHGVIRVHGENCQELPDILTRIYLGIFPNGNLAMLSAREKFQLEKVKVCRCCLAKESVLK